MRRLLLVYDLYSPPEQPPPAWLAPMGDRYDLDVIGWRHTFAGAEFPDSGWWRRLQTLTPRAGLILRALWLGRDCDVVLFHMPPPGVVVAALVRWLGLRYGRIVLISLMDYDKPGLRGLDRWLIGQALHEVAATTVASQQVRDRLAGLHGERVRARTHVLTDRALTGEAEPPAPDDAPAGYVFAGGASLRDWPVLAAAAREASDVPFVVIAGSDDPSARACDWPDNVRLLFDQPFAEFWRWLRHARLVVLPLRDAAGPTGVLVLGQAFRAGKAVIATDTVVTRAHVAPGENGLLVPAGQATPLAEAVRMLAADPERRAALERGAADAAERFTNEAFSKGLAAIVEGLFASQGPAALATDGQGRSIEAD